MEELDQHTCVCACTRMCIRMYMHMYTHTRLESDAVLNGNVGSTVKPS